MLCDVRSMPKNEILPLMKKMKRKANKRDCDVRQDGRWYMNINWDNTSSNWKFTSSAGYCGVGKVGFIYIEYYPPSGGNVRFDANVNRNDKDVPGVDEILDIYHELLVKYGGWGKNRISHFEKL